jgi:hypothetical protein
MKIISGGQTGADQAGLMIAKDLGFETGGWAPKNWQTSKGSQETILKSFNLIESDLGYRGRTYENVRDSNATIRLAVDFNTPGEVCTLQAINSCKKPWIDVDLLDPRPEQDIIEFLILVKPSILNIAGNTQDTKGYDIEKLAYNYLKNVLKEYKRIYIK